MPRAPRGSARLRRGRWYARVTLDAGKRVELALPTCDAADEDKAHERARILSDLAAQLREAGQHELAPALLERAAARDGRALDDVLEAAAQLCRGEAAVPMSTLVTFEDLGRAWTSGELTMLWPDHVRAKKTAHRDAGVLEARVYPLLGSVPLREVTLEHAERVMRALPANLNATTRRHYAQAIARVMKLAAYPVRAIERSPIPPGFVPPRAGAKALSYLYPDEDRALLGCTAVPLGFRVLFGFLAREGLRCGEARRLRWLDVDLARGAITLDRNKTNDPRAWVLDPGVARALAVWRKLEDEPADEELVFGAVPLGEWHAADQLRAFLQVAGVERAELFTSSRSRIAIRVHDLRGTFVTISLANGRSEAWVADRTGHRSSAMINRYRRLARHAAELGLGELAPLDEAIPELAPDPAEPARADEEGAAPDVAGAVAGAAASTDLPGSRKTPESLTRRAGEIGKRRWPKPPAGQSSLRVRSSPGNRLRKAKIVSRPRSSHLDQEDCIMRKTWTILGALLVTLTFSTAAFAQDEPDTTYDFDDDDVEGSYRSPLGDILVVRPGASHSSLIQPRAHFVPELMKSIETI